MALGVMTFQASPDAVVIASAGGAATSAGAGMSAAEALVASPITKRTTKAKRAIEALVERAYEGVRCRACGLRWVVSFRERKARGRAEGRPTAMRL